MPSSAAPEVWLRGPVPEVVPLLMPVARALLQAREDLERIVPDASTDELWQRPGGAAVTGYHLHADGATPGQ